MQSQTRKWSNVSGWRQILASDRLPSAYESKITEERDLLLGIRPEQVQISKTALDNYIPCRCNFAEPLGSRLLLNVELGGSIGIKIKVPMEAAIAVGDQLFVHLPKKDIMLFDNKTEQAL